MASWSGINYLRFKLTSIQRVLAHSALTRTGSPVSSVSMRCQLIDRVVRRVFVGLSQRRIVEYVIDQVINRAVVRHYHLSYMDELGGAGADAVNPQHPAVFLMDKQLEQPVAVTEHSSARQFLVTGDTESLAQSESRPQCLETGIVTN
jgi:hypothetical protein